jgi:hypothetical protein
VGLGITLLTIVDAARVCVHRSEFTEAESNLQDLVSEYQVSSLPLDL